MQSQCSLNALLDTIYKEDKFAHKELHYTTLGRSHPPGTLYISSGRTFLRDFGCKPILSYKTYTALLCMDGLYFPLNSLYKMYQVERERECLI